MTEETKVELGLLRKPIWDTDRDGEMARQIAEHIEAALSAGTFADGVEAAIRELRIDEVLLSSESARLITKLRALTR